MNLLLCKMLLAIQIDLGWSRWAIAKARVRSRADLRIRSELIFLRSTNEIFFVSTFSQNQDDTVWMKFNFVTVNSYFFDSFSSAIVCDDVVLTSESNFVVI